MPLVRSPRPPALLAAALLLAAAPPARAQSTLEAPPNLKGTWAVRPGTASFVFAHRFVSLHGGDELVNFPTLTLAVGLPGRFTVGLDHATNSETVADHLGGNETEYWVKRAFRLPGGVTLGGLAAYNGLAKSFDGAVTARLPLGRLTVLGEARGFSDMFGTGDAGFAAAGGGVLHVNRYLGVMGDVGRVLSADSFGTVWSGGVAVRIPGSPHTLSLYAGNGSVATLQGASRPRALFPDKLRWGFTFTVPLGGPRRWMQILRPPPEAPPADSSAAPMDAGAAAASVLVKDFTFGPGKVRIRAGQSVRWVNQDDDVHSAVADDGSWSSPDLERGDAFARRFDTPGRYPYYCRQHPDMTGVIVVE
jgi:plastocyanin